ncbi:hypothetical protein CcrColossus_gp233 [Caulobacter phage CcrColossus]|uniref:Uncharacterized protein n=1 Tax=Caulobacter phage CcrColossus TaxID=1211640 RepID=K4JW42_9CAUD|nr:hypothetical protein CcrColossus_gp233 [Caulobacter phage CcrColossus]AFU88103.1 hypothetical protein CcrColossus_gp233 [Caulobacter phage CcrColossus]
MFAEAMTDDSYLAALEADAQDQGARVDEAEWAAGLIEDVDREEWVWKNPRIGERLDLESGRQVYTILCDDGQEEEIKALILKLNKKLKKWDQTINILAEDEVIKEHWLRGHHVGAEVTDAERSSDQKMKFDYNINSIAYRGKVRQVLLTIDSPAVAGKKTKVIGSFELAEDGVEVYRHALNGASQADIEPFISRWRDCDHCGYVRNRRASFVCEDAEGNRSIIGRQCSRDFLGLDAAELLAREAIRKVLSNGGEEDEDRVGGGGPVYIHVETLVQRAYLVAKRMGGYSKDQRDTFLDHLAALEGARDYGRSDHYATLRAEYKEWVAKAKPEPLNFMKFADYVFSASGDFGHNLQIAFSLEWAKQKRRTLLAAGVGLYIGRLLKLEKEKAAQDRLPAKHLDAVEGKRVDFNGTVERTIPLSSDYGLKTLVSIVCPDGSRCVHFCTSHVVPEAGKTYAIRATVKEHKTNKRFGTPETVISRAIYEIANQPALL